MKKNKLEEYFKGMRDGFVAGFLGSLCGILIGYWIGG